MNYYRVTDRLPDRDRETDRHINIQTDRQTDRETDHAISDDSTRCITVARKQTERVTRIQH